MHTQNTPAKRKSFIVTLFLLLTFSASYAFSATTEKHNNSYNNLNNIVTNELKVRLQDDLFEDKLVVKLRTIKEKSVSTNEVEMKGQAFYQFPRKDIKVPIVYKAKVNVREREVVAINYEFVESKTRSANSPTAVEDALMDTLMNQINVDHKTDDIVIALNDSENALTTKNGNSFVGQGMVKINEGSWKKIEFIVELNLVNKKSQRAVYKLK